MKRERAMILKKKLLRKIQRALEVLTDLNLMKAKTCKRMKSMKKKKMRKMKRL